MTNYETTHFQTQNCTKPVCATLGIKVYKLPNRTFSNLEYLNNNHVQFDGSECSETLHFKTKTYKNMCKFWLKKQNTELEILNITVAQF